MRIIFVSIFFFMEMICGRAFASEIDEIKKIVAIQSAEIAKLKKDIADSNLRIENKFKNLNIVFEPLKESKLNENASITDPISGGIKLSLLDCNYQNSVIMGVSLVRSANNDGPYFDRVTCAKIKIISNQ